MKKLLTIFLLLFTNLSANDFKLERIIEGLDSPWSLTFIDNQNLLVTEKPGNIKFVNLKEKIIKDISHNLKILEDGQGGLLDILYKDNILFVSYSENRLSGKSSTSVARANLNTEKLNFKNIFQAQPPINSGYHFGSRLVIKNKHLYVTAGERGQGMIAQDHTKHPGSIIRINLDGSIPEDNPKFINKKDWLPEIYQIGVRNPQGMSLDPLSKDIFISNHGPKGGDFIGPVFAGTNYGWKKIGWGGTNYSGTKVGDGNAWEPGFLKPDFIWVPSIGVGGIKFYQGKAFPEWQNSLLVGSLKYQYLSVLHRENNKFVKEELILKDKIGRVRDLEINNFGEVFLIADELDSNLFILKP